MSSTSIASTSIASATQVSSKPWFLTFNAETRDLFIWKNGIRLKLKEGESAGGVRSASVLSIENKTITVSIFLDACRISAYLVFITCSWRVLERKAASSSGLVATSLHLWRMQTVSLLLYHRMSVIPNCLLLSCANQLTGSSRMVVYHLQKKRWQWNNLGKDAEVR